MRNLFVIVVFLSASSANAATNIESTEAAAGAEVMVRQVLDHKLLGPNAKNAYADLTRAIEGSGSSATRNNLESISCEAGLGSLYCEIAVSGIRLNEHGVAYSYTVTPRLYQGKVISARIAADSKRSQPVTWEVPQELKIGAACPAQAKQYDEIAFQVGGQGGYVCYTCDMKDQDLVVKTQSKCSTTISCESGVCL